ncbi:hypothetical protein LZ318_12910 [Saccharopolyspora indica]|uniref:hypothetical protein n=1 Tax=Saccharopolyspora indica TaxID=1229659 RepID=UPI0022EAAB35|nr:hypothetical protein [Saccharopolyspora indica]MDA3647205.1 hypothetical protein [Saccharopolyspora indica]
MRTEPNDRAALRFSVPEQTYRIPLAEEPRQRVARACESLLRARPDLTPAQCWDIVSAEERTLANLVREGAVYVGIIIARSEADSSRPTAARFGVLVKDAALPQDRPFDEIADELAALDEPREITLDEFPAGPGLLIVENTSLGSTNHARLAQVLLAFPDRKRIATLALSTEDTDDWEHHVDLLRAVARTVSFPEPVVVGEAGSQSAGSRTAP